jgi:hypothetical protein
MPGKKKKDENESLLFSIKPEAFAPDSAPDSSSQTKTEAQTRGTRKAARKKGDLTRLGEAPRQDTGPSELPPGELDPTAQTGSESVEMPPFDPSGIPGLGPAEEQPIPPPFPPEKSGSILRPPPPPKAKVTRTAITSGTDLGGDMDLAPEANLSRSLSLGLGTEAPGPGDEAAPATGGDTAQSLTSTEAVALPEPDDSLEAGDDFSKPIAPELGTPAEEQAPADVVEKVRQFSVQMTSGKETVPAAFPFSLLITGHLEPDEREKLLDVLSRCAVEIREVDLEPQFEADRLLIPRISEYSGILLVQALRTAQVDFRLGPADSIFATDDTRTTPEEELPSTGREIPTEHFTTDTGHPAELIPITSEPSLPDQPRTRTIDIVTCSAALGTTAVEAERSSEYAELLEALQRELKYKAHRRGANAILNFAVSLTPLSSPSRYRLTVSGSAVSVIDGAEPQPPLPENQL